MYFNCNNCCTKYIYYKIIINNYILINLILLIVVLWINDNNCNLERQILYKIDEVYKLLPYQMYAMIHYLLKQLFVIIVIGIYIIIAWSILYFRILRRFKIFKDIFG